MKDGTENKKRPATAESVAMFAFITGLTLGLMLGKYASAEKVSNAKSLSDQLKLALEEERYEDAVILRDKILSLKKG